MSFNNRSSTLGERMIVGANTTAKFEDCILFRSLNSATLSIVAEIISLNWLTMHDVLTL